MYKFRLSRKTKKKYQFFRSRISKDYWRKYFKSNHISWKHFVQKHSYFYYGYNQESYDTFKVDRTKGFICDYCGNNIDKYCEYPEHHYSEPHILLCEDCYANKYKTICPLCEDSYENDEMTNYFFITKATSKTVRKPVGMYEILKYPFYYGDCVTGFDAFFDDAIRKVSDMDIDEAYSILHPHSDKEILLDCICPRCAEKYLRKDNFIKADNVYCILRERERHKLFTEYSDERIHRTRQDMIHRRIAFRGVLQVCNK